VQQFPPNTNIHLKSFFPEFSNANEREKQTQCPGKNVATNIALVVSLKLFNACQSSVRELQLMAAISSVLVCGYFKMIPKAFLHIQIPPFGGESNWGVSGFRLPRCKRVSWTIVDGRKRKL